MTQNPRIMFLQILVVSFIAWLLVCLHSATNSFFFFFSFSLVGGKNNSRLAWCRIPTKKIKTKRHAWGRGATQPKKQKENEVNKWVVVHIRERVPCSTSLPCQANPPPPNQLTTPWPTVSKFVVQAFSGLHVPTLLEAILLCP
jgi:hypothetical protein